MSKCSILIPNRYTWDSIILAVESIRKRTRGIETEIIVCDNSMALNNRAVEPKTGETIDGDNGNRLEWLKEQARLGNIRLIENADQKPLYGHGENLKKLIAACDTEYAMLFTSTAEITRRDWLMALINLMPTTRDIGVAKFRPGGVHDNTMLRPPLYWPNMMMLNMAVYRSSERANDWDLEIMPYLEFPYPNIFHGDVKARAIIPNNPLVFCDTGWRFWARIWMDNPLGLRVQPLPDNYWNSYIIWRGGIDRNSHRPSHPHVQNTLAAVKQRLNKLRTE